jgi:DNA-binding response OmpR family regulator
MSAALGRILIVVDEPDVLEMLRLYFTDGRFEVTTAASGADALTVARGDRPDAVLLDIATPARGMDRMVVVRALRALDPSIAVVVVTSHRNEIVASEAHTIGAFDYVPKPFDFDVLDGIMMAAVAAGRAWPPRSAIAS